MEAWHDCVFWEISLASNFLSADEGSDWNIADCRLFSCLSRLSWFLECEDHETRESPSAALGRNQKESNRGWR